MITTRVPRSGKLQVSRWIAEVDKDVARKVYSSYWNSITPATDEDRFWFWIFAHLTVQQGWQASVRAFQHIKLLGDDFTKRGVLKALKMSRTGLYKKKPAELVLFKSLYQLGPHLFMQQPEHSLAYHRDGLVNFLAGSGIGQAKVSLALSMLHPNQDEIICIDRHIQRWYGVADEVTLIPALYAEIEDHFVSTAVKHGLHPGMLREMYWDSIQGFGNTRYWSYVLEPKHVRDVLGPPPEESDSRKQTRNRRKQAIRGMLSAIDRETEVETKMLNDKEQLEECLALLRRLNGSNGG